MIRTLECMMIDQKVTGENILKSVTFVTFLL